MGADGGYNYSWYNTSPTWYTTPLTTAGPTWYTYTETRAEPVVRPIGWLTRAARRTNKRPL